MTDFVNLHNCTTFSILNSLISPKELFLRAKELGQKAIAIADYGSAAAFWDGLKASKETGVKLIAGIDMYFVNQVPSKNLLPGELPEELDRFRHIILLAKNAIGYRNLLSLNKEGFDNSAIFAKKVYPLIDWQLLEKYHEGLICLTSCSNGIISQLLMNKKMEEAEKQLLRLRNIFKDDLGLEVQANTLKRNATAHNDLIDQIFINHQLIQLGKKHGIRVVATSNSHYLKKEDSETHDIMLAIGSHQPRYSNFRLKYDCAEFYVKSGDEIKAFFSRNYGEEYAEELCANSIFFADRCEEPVWIDPKFSNPSGKELPEFPCKEELDYADFLQWQEKQTVEIRGIEEDKQFLRFRCEQGFKKLIEGKIEAEKIVEYRKRLEEELDVLYYCGVSSYMLIVADYLNWCRKNDVPIGPGRGSGGGSFVGYLLEIHMADPIKYGLVFARFFNKLKAATADLDCDFSRDKRHLVLKYIIDKYGQNNVASISNIIGMKPKVYVRDIARACELGGSKDAAVELGNNLSDCITADTKNIDDALNNFPLFAEYANKYPEIRKFKQICNSPRSMGMHAAGIIISKRTLHEIVPIRKDKDGASLIEYDKDVSEANGLVKMDILGLSTLDIIDTTNSLIRSANKEVPIIDYHVYDEKTYDLISKGDTFGVFQFGTSAGTVDLCKKIKPTSIEDLALITTLARPSSKDIRESFIKTREGKKEVNLLHPLLGRAFEKTYGFPLYDESLLILAKDIAGWDLDEADKLRKLTKEKGKSPEKVKKWRQEFIDGAIKNGLHEVIADKIWEEIVVPYSRYTFNKSHAVLYSMISYHTAYLKAHFPVEFLLANLMDEVQSAAPSAAGNIAKIKSEIRSHRIKIIPPDINKSELRYTIEGNKLITGLDAMKFVSDEAIKDIIEKRPFTSFQDFISRVSSKTVRANTIQALACGGCLDSFGIPRHLMFLYCSDYRKKIRVWMKKHDSVSEEFHYPFPEKESIWTKPQLYAQEQFYLGEGFACKKEEAYGTFFSNANDVSLEKIKKLQNKDYVKSLRGIIVDLFSFKVKKVDSKYVGQEMVKISIEDVNGDRCGATIFPDRWMRMQDRMKELMGNRFKLEPGVALHFSGTANFYQEEMGIILDQLYAVAPLPQRPKELLSKKVNLREAKAEKAGKSVLKKNKEEQNPIEMFIETEDWAYEEGLIDLDEENDDDEVWDDI